MSSHGLLKTDGGNDIIEHKQIRGAASDINTVGFGTYVLIVGEPFFRTNRYK